MCHIRSSSAQKHEKDSEKSFRPKMALFRHVVKKSLTPLFQIYRDASGRAYVSRGRPHQGRNGEIDDVSQCLIVIKCHFVSVLAR